MQMLPARLGQAAGSALLRGAHRDRTGTGTGTGTGRRRGRTGAGHPRPSRRGVAEEEEPVSRCVSRGGERGGPGRTAARPRSGVTGTGEEGGGQWQPRSPRPHPSAPTGLPSAAPRIQPAAPSGRTGGGSGAGPGRCRCGRAGAPRAALGTAEPRPPPRRLGMAGYKKPVVCAALGAVIFTRLCAGRNARV